MESINCLGNVLDLTSPVLMGIINATPDSFYDGGQHNTVKNAMKRAEGMLISGAKILDIGGMSSRPGAEIIEIDEEIRRVVPIIKHIVQSFPGVILSIDTFRKEVAQAAVDSGASIINDISAGEIDPAIIPFAAETGIPYIMMHMKGIPSNMQNSPVYTNVVQQVLQYLIYRVKFCEEAGIKEIIVDPGFGFGKSLEHNYELLRSLDVFQLLKKPVLVGISRKSMIYKALDSSPEAVLAGTTAAHMWALQKGAKILRVHDVDAAKQSLVIWNCIEGQSFNGSID
jgi:dihydropteroate synthase